MADIQSTSSSSSRSSNSSKVFPLLDHDNLPINGGDKIGIDIQGQEFTISWHHIKYLVEYSFAHRLVGKIMGQNMPKRLLVLKGVSGRLRSGQLMGIMGPSGAGKSTLLECIISYRVKGRSGSVSCDSKRNLKMAFIPQHDNFFDAMTVRECLMFASTVHSANDRIRNGRTGIDNGKQVEAMLEKLGLTICADNAVSRCSGGQLKRLAIGQELLGHPDLLVLDEPTSGLDSAACFLVVSLLRELANDPHHPMAIVLTIHQPSYRVLEMFNVIYGLSNQGKCIFSGSPDDIVDIMTKNGTECPENYNPAEFLIDVASGEYGVNTLISLAAHQEAEFTAEADGQLVGQLGSLEDLIKPGKMANYAHFKQVVIRSLRVTIRDPWLFWLRFIAHTAFPLAVALQMQPDVGQRTGCPPDFDANFDPSELEEIQIYSKRETDSVFDNNGALAVGIIVTQFCSVMPTVLTFPLEMNVFRKEKINQWYGTGSYYLGKTVADIPFQLLFPVLFGAILFYFSNQTGEWWRVTGAVLVLVVIAFAGQAHGLLVGALSMRNKSVGVYFAPFTMIPQILFCGFFLKLEDLNPIFYPMTYLSYAKNGLESMIGFVYGFQRCGADAEENMAEARQGMVIWFSDMLGVTDGRTGVTLSFVDNLVKLVAGDFVGDDGKVRSILMNHYALDDSYILPSVVYMVLMTVSIRLITYFIVVRQANSKN